MTNSANPLSTVKGAVALRRWAVSILAGRWAAEPGPLSRRSWGLFLEAERCAVPLMRGISQHDLRERLSPEFRVQIEERANVELERIESARRQLAVAADVAAQLGCKVVALKGSVAAMDPEHAVDLVDVDVLVELRYAREYVAELDRRGYRAGGSSIAHLAARWSDEPLPIEVHTTLGPSGRLIADDLWSELRASEQFDGVHLLCPSDHLWYILMHVVSSHPNRHGHLRELLLIGSAIEMVGLDLSEIGSRISTVPERATMKGVIQAAQELRDGTAHPDVLIEVPTLGYAVRRVLSHAPVPAAVAGHAHMWSLGFLMGPGLRKLLLNQIWYVTHDPSHVPWLRKVERRFPTVGRIARLAVRLIRFALAVIIAIPVAGVAALTTRRALDKA